MTQAERMFVVKASTMRLGATRAHNLYSKMKGGEQYVHGTSNDFKNHIRDADEFDKCNYKEFGDIISFDATFRTNKYDMVFVPFTGIDNHRKCVTVGSGLLLSEDIEAYTWLLTSFMTAHEKQPTMIVTDQDGAMKLAIEKVLTESKHRLSYFIDSPLFGLVRTSSRSESENAFFKSFTNHGSTLLNFMMCFESAMERQRSVACQIQEFKTKEGCEMVKVRDKRAAAYRTLNKEKGKEVMQEKEYVAEYKNRDIEVILEKYILRRWRRDIIPPALRRNPNRYGEKNETIEKLTNKANFVVDECLFLLSKDEDKLAKFVEQLKNIKNEVQSQVPKPPSQKTRDVIKYIYAIEKPKQNNINNPQRAINKGGRRGERRKSERELVKEKTKQGKKCGHCGEKTNKHTKIPCPSNPKYIAKLARIAAEQAAKDAAEDAAKNDVAAEQPRRTNVVEESTNAS
ncbi:zinc finger, SWIM-type containing protein [Tanacetum coccineum]|uniref:Zinc finger, SWIM-type containing protein n=1 Tax=Tanacetum coccineum TaxID=301880 RepID=A0ABQ4XFR2_9ASTR